MGSCLSAGGGCCFGCVGGIVATASLMGRGHRGDSSPHQKPPPKGLERLRERGVASLGTADAEWLNGIVKELWPRIDSYVQNLVKTSIEPSIAAKLHGAFAFTEVKLGGSHPKFGPLLVMVHEGGDIIMEVGVDLTTDMVIAMRVAGIPVGVKEVVFRGVVSIVMRRKAPNPPFFGGLEMYFANPPQVDLTFTGAASLAEQPTLRGVIRSTIAGVLNGKFVLPNRIAVDMDADDTIDAFELKRPLPAGVLRVGIKSAKGLLACDKPLFGSSPGTSDPYVVMSAAGGPFQTPTLKATVDPVWTKDNEFNVYIYVKEQNLSFTIFDEDWGGDDLMGEVKDVNVAQLMKPSGLKPLVTDLPVEKQGSLSISSLWLELSSKGPCKELAGPQLYIAVAIDHCAGLPETGAPPYNVTVQITKDFQAMTGPSFAKAAKVIPEEVKSACVNLSRKGMSMSDIAEVMDLTEQQAKITVHQETHPLKAKEAINMSTSMRAARNPQFQEVIEMLLPWSDDIGVAPVTLSLLDKSKTLLGSVDATTVNDLAGSIGGGDGIEGPFLLGGGRRIAGRMRLRWLVPAK